VSEPDARGTPSRRPDSDETPLERSLENFQDNVRRAGPVAAASYGLIGAILVLGAIGYALDKWRGTSPWFLLGGLLLGLIVGFYDLVMVVFFPRRRR